MKSCTYARADFVQSATYRDQHRVLNMLLLYWVISQLQASRLMVVISSIIQRQCLDLTQVTVVSLEFPFLACNFFLIKTKIYRLKIHLTIIVMFHIVLNHYKELILHPKDISIGSMLFTILKKLSWSDEKCLLEETVTVACIFQLLVEIGPYYLKWYISLQSISNVLFIVILNMIH